MCEQAIKVYEGLVKSAPKVWVNRRQLGESYFRLGQVQYDMKHLAEAAADWKKAIQQYADVPSLNFESCFLSDLLPRGPGGACRKTGLRGFGRGGPGRAEKGPDLAARDREDFRNRDAYRNETGFDPIRKHPEFLSLMNDLAKPARPIANGQSPTASTVQH